MCVLSVADSEASVNPPRSHADPDSGKERGTPIQGWPAKAGRKARAREARQPYGPTPLRSYGADTWRGFLPEKVSLDSPLAKWPHPNERDLPRVESIVLTSKERAAVQSLLRSSNACGTLFRAFRRSDLDAHPQQEYRMVCQVKCGTRACASCLELIRARAAARCESDYGMFVTLTVPPDYGDVRGSWKRIGSDLRRFLKAIRKEARKRDGTLLRLSRESEMLADIRSLERGKNPDNCSPFEYSWALEPHKSGMPHVHIAMNAEWIDYSWIIELWRDITGCKTARLFGVQVYSTKGICRYLTKYITKQVLTMDLLGLMKGKRLWGTSLPILEKPDAIWEPESDQPQAASLKAELEEFESYGAAEGWIPVSSKAFRYGVWVRELDLVLHPIIRLDGRPEKKRAKIWWIADDLIASAELAIEADRKRNGDNWHEACY